LRVFHRAVFPDKPFRRAPTRRFTAASSDQSASAPPPCDTAAPSAPRRRFAILFGGTMEMQHLNNLELTYRTLVDKFGFAPENIFRLIHDGTYGANGDGPYIDFGSGTIRPWPGSAADPTFRIKPTAQGSTQAFKDVLTQLNTTYKIGSNDLLFIHTECHGARELLEGDDHVYLCAFPTSEDEGADRYHAYEMAADLSPLQCGQLLVLMNQCYGGGFQQPVVNATKAATYIACAADASSLAWATIPDLTWNEFSLHWLEAQLGTGLDGESVDADYDHSTKIEASEAYCHAAETDTYGDDTPNQGNKPSSTSQGDRIVLSAS
jgi:hypothetical protein